MTLMDLIQLVDKIIDKDETFLNAPIYVATATDKFVPALQVGVYDAGDKVGNVIIISAIKSMPKE